MLPVLFAMFLQAMYGAVDLLVVGKYCGNADVSAVSTGSQIILTLTNLLVSLSMGITVAVGEKIGQKKPDEASMTIGTGLVIFAILGVMFTIISVFGAALLAKVMQAPKEAFDVTVSYIRICGAGKTERANMALKTGIAISFVFGIMMFALTFFRGDLLAGIFSNNNAAVMNAWDYLKAYAIDCLLTCFLFCFIGYFNGLQKTTFVMAQGIVGAFLVRIPVAFLMRHIGNGSLFLIGLATPCSTIVQIIMCFIAYRYFSTSSETRA